MDFVAERRQVNALTAPPSAGLAQGPIGPPQPQPPQGGPPPTPPTPPTRDEITEAIEKVHYLNDGLRLLLNKEGGPSRSDVIDETGHLISEGILSPQAAAQEIQSLPDDNGAIKSWLQNHIMNSAITRGKLLHMLAAQGGQQQISPQQPDQPQMPQNALTAGMPQGG